MAQRADGFDTGHYGISGHYALQVLQERYGFPEAQAKRILEIARTHTYDAEPITGGILHIRYRGNVSGRRGHRLYELEADVMNKEEQAEFNRKRGLPTATRKVYTQEEAMPSRYSSGKAKTRQRKGRREMPPRKSTTKARTAPEPAEQPANGENGDDLASKVQKALDKETYSATMNDYLDWFTENVVDPSDLSGDLDRLMVMTLQFYGPFQRSDFNASQRDKRATERETAKQAQEEPEEPAKPARGRGRPPAKATATKTATGRTAPAKAGPTRRTRGTKATAAAASGSGSTPY